MEMEKDAGDELYILQLIVWRSRFSIVAYKLFPHAGHEVFLECSGWGDVGCVWLDLYIAR